MVTPRIDPTEWGALPEPVLLELGRLVWAAINLEDVVYSVCRAAKPRDTYDDTPAGPRIDRALDDLQRRPDDELRRDAEAWLNEAKAALMDRNHVVHAVPCLFVPLTEDVISGDLGTFLTHFPRKGKGEPVHIPLTVRGLRPIVRRLTEARVRWAEVATSLYERKDDDPEWALIDAS